ncbi:MAG TPA: helix-turn-helix transcriptional regulator [Solirubrobacterales bacterium]|nr:helix-turn-helix transcriptional regulator [Solirubrobacterales bacterium]
MSASSNPQRALGAAIRALRLDQDAKQQAVAEAAGITVAHLSKIERGLTNPTWGTVTAIAEALGVSVVEVAKRSVEFKK